MSYKIEVGTPKQYRILSKLVSEINELEVYKEDEHNRTVKFRKFLFRLDAINGPYENAVLTPREIISLYDATADKDMGEKFFKNLVDKFLIDPDWRKEPKKSGFPKKSKFYVKKVV